MSTLTAHCGTGSRLLQTSRPALRPRQRERAGARALKVAARHDAPRPCRAASATLPHAAPTAPQPAPRALRAARRSPQVRGGGRGGTSPVSLRPSVPLSLPPSLSLTRTHARTDACACAQRTESHSLRETRARAPVGRARPTHARISDVQHAPHAHHVRVETGRAHPSRKSAGGLPFDADAQRLLASTGISQSCSPHPTLRGSGGGRRGEGRWEQSSLPCCGCPARAAQPGRH